MKSFFKLNVKKMKFVIFSLFLGSLFLIRGLFATVTHTDVAVPNAFERDTVISASLVNANFSALAVGLNSVKSVLVSAVNSIQANLTTVTAGLATLTTQVGALKPKALGYVPQGRLSLSATEPVPITNVLSATTIHYHRFVGSYVPVFGGTNFDYLQIPVIPATLDLTVAWAASNLYDIFAYDDGGTLNLCRGPAWTSTTVRGAPISQREGIWVNTGAMFCYPSTGGSFSISAESGTYLGTVYTSSAGTTQMHIQPTAATGGSNPLLGLYNAYNRVRVSTFNSDTVSTSYSSAAWRPLGNSSTNSVRYVDGLSQSAVRATLNNSISVASGGRGFMGINRDSITSPASNQATSTSTSLSDVPISVSWTFVPAQGFHKIYALESNMSAGYALTQNVITTFMLSVDLDI